MSIELPEARILAQQLDETLSGKTIKSYDLKDVDRMSRIGFINKNTSDFENIVGKTVSSAVSRGNTIRLKINDHMNILIAPEYGGVITYITEGEKPPRYHLKLEFSDGSILTIRITSMGLIYVVDDEGLKDSYMYKRDFLRGVSPDEAEFTFEWFKNTIGSENKQLKPLLVGKDASIIGVSNASFQDVLYRAKIHPKKKASQLSEKELKDLYEAIKTVINNRLSQGGKEDFNDIFGVPGRYIAAMGPNLKDSNCPRCGTAIQKLAHGGGHVYLCPNCQSE